MRPVGVTKKGKKNINFHASNWLFPQTTDVDVAPEILPAGSYPGGRPSYIFQVSWKSVQGSRPLPLTRPMAYTTACTIVQAVMRTIFSLPSPIMGHVWRACAVTIPCDGNVIIHNSGTDNCKMLKIGMCFGCIKLNAWDTTEAKKSKVKVTGRMKIVHKNIKYMPQTSSDSGNIPAL